VRTDSELLDAWTRGEESAGRDFYLRYADRIARFFARKTADDVPDLVQRTFLKCLDARKRGVEVGNAAAMLFAIARNELYDAFRRQRAALKFDAETTSLEDLKTGVSQRLARHEEQRLLLTVLAHIPLDDQLAIELYYWEDLSMDDVARVLGVTRSAAINRVHRARELIRDRLGELEVSAGLVEETMAGFDTWARTLAERP
jgi:RNA polymerase sigma-70 factor (ECF subfamily)